jgi:CSLREA domain-containing protein
MPIAALSKYIMLTSALSFIVAMAISPLYPANDGHVQAAPAFNTITVTTVKDIIDSDGVCSLREAIIAANSNSAFSDCTSGTVGLDTIEFAIGSGTPSIIINGLPLPSVTDLLIIQGNSGGATRVELNGLFAGENANGLTIQATGVEIKHLVINRFSGWGLEPVMNFRALFSVICPT